MKLYAKGIDYYCPKCETEFYTMAVHNVLTNGGVCSCGQILDAGESMKWGTMNGDVLLTTEMSDQHLSNVIYFLNDRLKKQLLETDYVKKLRTIRSIMKDELQSRGLQKVLKYKPYYAKDIEDKIYNI